MWSLDVDPLVRKDVGEVSFPFQAKVESRYSERINVSSHGSEHGHFCAVTWIQVKP